MDKSMSSFELTSAWHVLAWLVLSLVMSIHIKYFSFILLLVAYKNKCEYFARSGKAPPEII